MSQDMLRKVEELLVIVHAYHRTEENSAPRNVSDAPGPNT
jgi:hypothetical protein